MYRAFFLKNLTPSLQHIIKNSRVLIILVSLLLFSCGNEIKILGDFKLLPLPQEFEITGTSDFDCSNVHLYFNTTKEWLPVFDEQLNSLEETNDISKAEGVIDLPDPNNKGTWTEKHKDRLAQAGLLIKSTDRIAE